MKVSPARVAAFRALHRILEAHEHSSSVLPSVEYGLSPPDRGLCHEIVLGTLRRLILIDRHIDRLAGGRRIDHEVRNALRIGVFQLGWLDRVPTHAAVNDSVEIVRMAKKTSAKGFVNAILRKLGNGLPDIEFKVETERVAVSTSHPQWLIERWILQFGNDQAIRIAEANNTAPVPEFRWTLKTAETDRMTVENCGADERSRLLRELAADGRAYFQDLGSQAIARAVAPRRGEQLLDACAAPGGKTALSAMLAEGDNLIVAGDLSQRRVSVLQENLARQGAEDVQVVRFDAAVGVPFADESFDKVLVDAPCSGTGTIRSNPEIRYLISPDCFDRFASKQLAILLSASKSVRAGGRLFYSTCSLERDENEEVCERFVAASPGFRPVLVEASERFKVSGLYLRSMPHEGGDGFFLAAFEKK